MFKKRDKDIVISYIGRQILDKGVHLLLFALPYILDDQKETPFQDIIPKLKVKGPQKKTPLANNYVVDTNGISKGINTYINLKKEKENPPKEIVKTQPTIPRGGLEDVLNSDTFYRRKRGLDF